MKPLIRNTSFEVATRNRQTAELHCYNLKVQLHIVTIKVNERNDMLLSLSISLYKLINHKILDTCLLANFFFG